MGHEFDAEDIGMMASTDGVLQGERFRQSGRVVFPDVKLSVITPTRQQAARSRPTKDHQITFVRKMHMLVLPQGIDAAGMATELVDNVEIFRPGCVAIQALD
jgi:hypothetical protein